MVVDTVGSFVGFKAFNPHFVFFSPYIVEWLT